MRKLMFLLTLLGASLTFGVSAQEPTALRITNAAGERTDFLFDDKPEISFTADGLRVTSVVLENPVIFDFDDVESMEFLDLSGIDHAEVSNITLRVTPADILLGNLPSNSTVELYALDGRRLLQARAEGEYLISRSRLEKGIYILKINKSVFKISL